jgi:hypothetical protein
MQVRLRTAAVAVLVAGVAVGLALMLMRGQVMVTNGDCLPPPGPPSGNGYRCYITGHPHAALGIAVVLVSLVLSAALVLFAHRDAPGDRAAFGTLRWRWLLMVPIVIVIAGVALSACGRGSPAASAPRRGISPAAAEGSPTTPGPVLTQAVGGDVVDLSGINDPPYLIPSPPEGSGVEGKVMGIPSCSSWATPCQVPSGPIEATVAATDASSGAVIGSVRSVTTRDFLLALPAGRYVLVADGGADAQCEPLTVTVPKRPYVMAELSCIVPI